MVVGTCDVEWPVRMPPPRPLTAATGWWGPRTNRRGIVMLECWRRAQCPPWLHTYPGHPEPASMPPRLPWFAIAVTWYPFVGSLVAL